MSMDKRKKKGDSEMSMADKHIRNGKTVLEKHMKATMPKKAAKKTKKKGK
jgi:hypothetical protein